MMEEVMVTKEYLEALKIATGEFDSADHEDLVEIARLAMDGLQVPSALALIREMRDAFEKIASDGKGLGEAFREDAVEPSCSHCDAQTSRNEALYRANQVKVKIYLARAALASADQFLKERT
jgi:hypothetical protein